MSEETAATPSTESNLSRNQIWGLIGLMMLISAFFFYIDRDTAPQLTRNMVPTAGFTQQHVLTGVTLAGIPAVMGETAVFAGTFDPDVDPRIIALDIVSGDERWQIDGVAKTIPDEWPADSTWIWPFAWQWGPLLIQDDRVILADAFALTTSLTAYDLTTGDQLWEQTLGWLNGSDVSYLTLIDGNIAARVVAGNFSEFYIFDFEKGWQLYRRPGDAATLFWWEEEPPRTYEATNSGVTVSENRPWTFGYSSNGVTPQMTENLIVLQLERQDVADTFGLLVLNRADGSLQWRLDTPLVGNVVVDNGRILTLTAAANLLVLDLATGTQLAELPFTPDLAQPDETIHYALGASGNQIAIYFGDSQELHFYQFNN
ncbi:MAG: PQQ-binding-like beta-propeller repeat protein [Chloroflexi bacterium]|nr:PQQ-binding-like beta-propeller repeat protein [Chloroflexota bacterium]